MNRMLINAEGMLLDEAHIDFATNANGDIFGLRNINLEFNKINLFVGESRSFKSTILNVIRNYRNVIAQQVYYFSQNHNEIKQLRKLLNNINANGSVVNEPFLTDFENFMKSNLDVQSLSLNPVIYNSYLPLGDGNTYKMPLANENEKVNYCIEIEHDHYKYQAGKVMSSEDKGFTMSTELEPLANASSGTSKVVLLYYLLKHNLINISAETIILIDELENSLSPIMLKNVCKLLFKLAERGVQLFISSHSPDVIEEFVIADRQFSSTAIFKMQNYQGSPEVSKLSICSSIFPTYPTAAELKWKVFNKPSIDFHEQLWAKLSYDGLTNTVKNVNSLDSDLRNAAAGDNSKLKSWKGYQADKMQPEGRRPNSGQDTFSLSAYIRNYLHHPEFTDANNVPENSFYSDEELRCSIEFMLDLLNAI